MDKTQEDNDGWVLLSFYVGEDDDEPLIRCLVL
jgi:hypothetical protein